MAETITITRDVFAAIVAQARAELPCESCGLLLGTDALAVDEHYAMTNVDHSTEHFSFDPREQFAAVRHARAVGKRVVANWHSHPATMARPSLEDIRLAFDPSIVYFILSLAAAEPDLKAYRVKDGWVTPLRVDVV